MADENRKHLNRRGKAVVLILLACAAAAGGITAWRAHARARAEREMEELAAQTLPGVESPLPEEMGGAGEEPTAETGAAEEPPDGDGYPSPEELGIPVPDKTVDIKGLQEEANSDIYAWIYIPDSRIDYPVLQSQEELDYYLDTNLDGTKGRPGCIYTQMMNSMDWTDRNTVLYGHNMRDGSMFAGLHKYEDPEYFSEHPYVYIYTEDGLLVYQIFAAYEYYDRNLLLFHDISTDEKYQRYLDSIFENDGWNSIFDEEAELDAEDRIITLSTCVGSKPDKRFLVQAVLTAES